ncbi:hypothetical protein ACS0TY_025471 [Phlomoides rotata]
MLNHGPRGIPAGRCRRVNSTRPKTTPFSIFRRKLVTRKTTKKLPPGPRSIPILGHFHLLGKNPHQDLSHLAQKYGPLMSMRFGSVPAVVVTSPAAAELILKTHDLAFASRPSSEVAKYIGYGQRNLIFLPYGADWRNLRKLCTLELLSTHKINQFRAMRRAELGLLVGSIKQSAQIRETVDLSAAVFGLSGDMNCLTVLGRKYSDKEFDDKGFNSVFKELSEVAAKFNVADYFPHIGGLDLQGLNRRMKQLSEIFDGFFEKIIDDHVQNRKQDKKKGDFVDTILAIMESGEAGFEFDRRHVKGLLLDLLVAGSDTSAASAEWTLSELIRHPAVMKKLQKELESVVGMDHTVEESHLDKLQYLDCVVKEAFRLHPVVPLLLPHESIEDCVVDGYHIPKKSRIMVNVWAIGRDPNVWHDPLSFTPERFMGSNIDVKGHNFQLLPFSSGRRGCPGMQLGLTVVKLVVAQLVHCFQWELPQGMLPTDMDMSEHFAVVTARANHLKINS